jgi:hypothetical protein
MKGGRLALAIDNRRSTRRTDAPRWGKTSDCLVPSGSRRQFAWRVADADLNPGPTITY